ncbi:MAG: DUF1800 family protein, partial [Planctomycetota bacterium]
AIITLIAAGLAPHAAATPEVSSAAWQLTGDAVATPLTMTGASSIETRAFGSRSVVYTVAFDRPVTSLGPVSCDGGVITLLDFVPGEDSAEIWVTPDAPSTYCTVTLLDVRADSGTLPAVMLPLGLLVGDASGNRRVDTLDWITLMPALDEGDPSVDFDDTGTVDAFDYAYFYESLGIGGLPDAPPLVSPVPTQRLDAGGASPAVPIVIRDLEGAALIVSAISDDQSLVTDADITLIDSAGLWTVAVTGSASGDGTAEISIVADDGTQQSTVSFDVVLAPNQAPDARINLPQYLGVAPLLVEADAIGSSDAEGLISSYAWDFGDGAQATGAEVTHTFTTPGEYTVVLTVTDAGGLTAVAERVVTVADGSFLLGATPTDAEARRFLWQAAFGPTQADVDQVIADGYEQWIDDQIAMTPTPMLFADAAENKGRGYGSDRLRELFDDFAVEAPDQLRQRIAWALSQLIVINEDQDGVNNEGAIVYYNNYLSRSFENFRDLIEYVTFTYNMANYLTYHDNRKENTAKGTFPDENYAREIIQLFTIGLYELNLDGTRILDGSGKPIATYDNEDIQQFARIFTGLYRDSEDRDVNPMTMREQHHEFGDKQLLDYPGAIPSSGYIPARPDEADQTEANALADIAAAHDNLFYHPNCAPFVCAHLIRNLVKSNPTPAYVARVSAVFEDDGTGTRGNLGAVVKAILMDPEARDPAYTTNPATGKVMEPIVAEVGLFRLLERVHRPLETFPFRVYINPNGWRNAFGQSPMQSPSVFNFFTPDYVPANTDLERGSLVSPEIQIHNAVTAIAAPNEVMNRVIREADADQVSPRYAEWIATSNADTDPDAALIDLVAAELMVAPLTTEARTIMITALNQINGDNDRVRAAVYLVATSPERMILP